MLVLIFLNFLIAGLGYSSHITLKIPGAEPRVFDSYLCSAFNIDTLVNRNNLISNISNKHIFVTEFKPLASSERVHHLLLYMCDNILQDPGEIYDCAHHAVCPGARVNKILFAWAKNAGKLVLPKDVSFRLPLGSSYLLVLQIHYVHPLSSSSKDYSGLQLNYQQHPTLNDAGILLLARSNLIIPGNREIVHGDVNCQIKKKMNVFAFRAHAHSLGVVITGYNYLINMSIFEEIARGNPQWPQAFYPTKKNVILKPGDFVLARCTYNSSSRITTTYIGGLNSDEMCNLYLMYYVKVNVKKEELASYTVCMDEVDTSLSKRLPLDSDWPMPTNKILENMAVGDDDISTKSSRRIKGDLESQDLAIDQRRRRKKVHFYDGNSHIGSPNDIIGDLRITIPGALPTESDAYLCTSFKVDSLLGSQNFSTDLKNIYLTKFSALNADNAHHVILSECSHPTSMISGEIWNCMHHSSCTSSNKILFAYAKNAPATKLPPEVGFELSFNTFLVLQVHYKTSLSIPDYTTIVTSFTTKRLSKLAGIYLLVHGPLNIPANRSAVHADVSCRLSPHNPSLNLFAFRTHAHDLATVITGYLLPRGQSIEQGNFSEIARGNPQLPQMFYPMKHMVRVGPQDILAARCTYNTLNKTTVTKIGATSGDEMCNLYLMYFTDANSSFGSRFIICTGQTDAKIAQNLPNDSDTLLGMIGKAEEIPISYTNSHTDAMSSSLFVPMKPKKVEDDAFSSKTDFDWLNAIGTRYQPITDWPITSTAKRIGQVSGVAIDIYGNVVIFHRGDRTWRGDSFNSGNVYTGPSGAISANTVLTLNSSGHVINECGANVFYMPHMLSIDNQNNFWVTDVALHQVFKFLPYGMDKEPLVSLGTRFKPGDDATHFCKPTSVAISSDGVTFYVADGYCNARIIKYRLSDGNDGDVVRLMEWSSPKGMNIPHSLTLAEDVGLICVADRENGLIQCFSAEDGRFFRSIASNVFGKTVYAIAYVPSSSGLLYAVTGLEFLPTIFGGKKPQLFAANITTGHLMTDSSALVIDAPHSWRLNFPHDLAVSKNGTIVYIAEISPARIIKMTNLKIESTKNDSNEVTSSWTTIRTSFDSKRIKQDRIFNTYFSKMWIVLLSFLTVCITSGILTCILYIWCNARKKAGFNRFGSVSKRKMFQPLKTTDDDFEDDDFEDSDEDFQKDDEKHNWTGTKFKDIDSKKFSTLLEQVERNGNFSSSDEEQFSVPNNLM